MRVTWSLPLWVWPLLAGAALLLAAWVRRQYGRAAPPPGPSVRRWLIGLRCAALLLLLLAVAGPSLLRVTRQTRPPEVAVIIDDSASMALDDTPGGTSRWRRALRLTATADSVLRRREPAVRAVFLRGSGLAPAAPFSPDAPDLPPPVAVGSDLAALLKDAAGRGRDHVGRGVLLISDGQDTAARLAAGGPETDGAAELLIIGVGDPEGPPDLWLQDLRYPERSFQGEEIVVELTIGRRGAGGAEPGVGRVTARLRQGERIVAEGEANTPAVGGAAAVELTLRPLAAGLQVYDLEIAPLANERYLDNNRATLAVDVRPGRARLLLLTGRPGWDARFLAQGALATQRLETTVVRGGGGGLLLADSGRAWISPRDAGEWRRRWDGVVLLGWADLGQSVDWASLAGAVQAGLGLLVLAADEPASADRPGPPPGPLAELLPVEMTGAGWLVGDWLAQGAPGAEPHTLLAGVVQDVPAGGGLDSGRLPPLRRLLDATQRAAGKTLLTAVPARSGGGAARPLLVVVRAGEGRVTWFGGRRLWELAFWEGPRVAGADLPHPGRLLVRNLLLWTASGGEEEGLRLAGHRKVWQLGERVRLEARWRDAAGAPVAPGRSLSLVLRGPLGGAEERARAFAMAPLAADPSRASVVLPPLPPGRYAARPVAAGDAPLAGPEEEFVVAAQSPEAAQTRQDRRALRALAAAAGGVYLPGDAADAETRLAAALARWPLPGDVRVVRRHRDLAAGWPLLVLVVGLLGAEWALRRRHGLL